MEGSYSADQSMLPSHLRPGVIVDGKYRIDGVLGRGGMGVVVAATHVHLGEPVALKFLQARTSEDEPEDFRARFEREARVCAKLRNEHVVRVLDVGVWDGRTPYMVMDLLVGYDLRRVMKEKGRLPAAYAVDVAVQICEGLAEAHALGIVHRDLKPPNVFLTRRRDGSDLVKVLDFGISKWAAEAGGEELTKAGTLLGSPKYMSPEQLNEAGVDARSDVWAIGALVYAMLTGRPPYDMPNVTQTFVAIAAGSPPPSPRTFEPSIPPELEAVVMRCLVHDKAKRIANVADLAGDLLDAIGVTDAAMVRDRLRAVLDPTAAPAIATLSLAATGRITAMSGSYTPVSVTGNRVSAAAPPLATEPLPPRRAPSRAKRWGLVGGVALAAVLGVVALTRPGEGSAAAAPDAASRATASKRLDADPPTTLTVPSAPSALAQAPAFASRRRVEPARSAVSSAPSDAPAPVEAAPPAPPSPPLAAPTASAKRAPANALDDRQ
jgi:serine/threonine-protein kinase